MACAGVPYAAEAIDSSLIRRQQVGIALPAEAGRNAPVHPRRIEPVDRPLPVQPLGDACRHQSGIIQLEDTEVYLIHMCVLGHDDFDCVLDSEDLAGDGGQRRHGYDRDSRREGQPLRD